MILTVTLNPCIDKTITVDGFKIGGLNRTSSVREDFGGKGINVSKVLSAFGEPSVASGICAGEGGRALLKYLEKQGIEHRFIQENGNMRTNYKIVDGKTRVTTEINESGFAVSAETAQRFVNVFETAVNSGDIVILSGSVANGFENDIYFRLAEAAAERGAKVILDADGAKLKLGIKAKPYAIKPNLPEFEELLGRRLTNIREIAEAAKSLAEDFVQCVIVSMGADGAVIVNRDNAYVTKPFEIECKSTVAAGDSMVAALAYAIKKGFSDEKTAKFITAAGTITASKEGTQVCSLREVTENTDRVSLKKVF